MPVPAATATALGVAGRTVVGVVEPLVEHMRHYSEECGDPPLGTEVWALLTTFPPLVGRRRHVESFGGLLTRQLQAVPAGPHARHLPSHRGHRFATAPPGGGPTHRSKYPATTAHAASASRRAAAGIGVLYVAITAPPKAINAIPARWRATSTAAASRHGTKASGGREEDPFQ